MKLKNVFLSTLLALGPTMAMAQSTNIRVNPLGLLIGMLNADVDFKVGETFTIGPRLGYFSVKAGEVKASAFAIGARANIYVTGAAFTDGWYVGPSFTYSRVSFKDGTQEGSGGSIAIAAVGGYQWVWPSGFNMNLGLGPQYLTLPDTVKDDDGNSFNVSTLNSGILPAIEFTIGAAF